MLTKILLHLTLLAACWHHSVSESDSEPSDATSRIRFVQYQPATVTVIPLGGSDSTASPKGQESRRSEYFENTLNSPLRPQEKPAEQENRGQINANNVPKNYAFSYAIRDRNSGDDFSHTQAHNGEATKGEYRVKLPDGRVQIVTYTADNGGYRADIRYDKGETQTAIPTNTNRPNVDKTASPHPVLFSNNFGSPNKQQMADKKDSALLYFNEIRTFDPPVRTKAASYETVEHVDEEPYPYSKKLLADVNYLLKYVTPTVETQTENVFDITPDHKALENRRYLPQNSNSNEQQSGQQLQKIPYKLLKIEDLKFDHPILNSAKYDKSKFDSLPPITARPLTLNLTTRLDPTHVYMPQYNKPRESARYVPSYEKYVPGYESGQLPQLITPKYILKFEDPPRSTPNYESLERPQFSTPSYQSTANPPARGPQFVRFEPKGVSPSTSPIYDLQNPSTLHDQPQYIPTFRPPVQETTPFIPRERYILQHDPSQRYLPQRVQSLRPEKPTLELPVNSGERFNEIQVSVYHAPGFEPLNLKDPQFQQPSPSPPRLYLTPALPLPPFNDPRYVSKDPGASQFKPEDFPAIPQSIKTTSQPEEAPQFNPAHESPPVTSAPGFNSQEFPPVSAAPNFNPKDFPPVTAAPIQDSHEQINNLPVTPQFRPTSPAPDDRRPSGEGHFGKIEIPQYLHIHRYEDSGENAKPKELIYYTPLHISVPNSVAYMEHGNQNITGSFTPSYVTMTEHPRLLTNTDTDFFHDRQPNYERPHSVVSEGPPPPLDSTENFHSNNQGTTPRDEPEELSHWRPSSPTAPTGHGDHSREEPEQYEKPGPYEKPEHYEKPMSDFDARIYSGYFDFIPTSETESASKPIAEDSREAPQIKPCPESPSESYQSTPLPQYYYDFSTATPIHRYISAEVESHESNLVPEEDQIRNSSFRSSAYLRPLRKERVYIHHNALPTTTANDPFVGKDKPPKPYKDANVSIVKSISSTIPPELLKDFDLQLRSSTFRRDSSKSSNDITETKVLPPTLNPKLKELIVKKLQAAIPTAGKVYLKTSAQQKRTVR